MKIDAETRLRRCLHLIDLNPAEKLGSLEEQTFVLAKAMHESDSLFVPVFSAPPGPEAKKLYRTVGIPVEWLNLKEWSWITLRRLLRLVRRHRIEIIDWVFYDPLNPYYLFVSLLRPNIKHYFTDQVSRIPGTDEGSSGAKQFLKRILLSRYDKALCISDFVLESLRRQDTWPKLVRYGCFVNTNRFRPDGEARAKLRREMDVDSRFVVLTVANLIPWKGIDVAIRSLLELPERVELWVVGGGEEWTRLQALCAELELSPRTRFFGKQRDVLPYLQAADCFACPSLWAEAMGFVNLEALACGLPVVASSIGGLPEFIEDGVTGILFRTGDHHELAMAIQALAEDPEKCARMGAAARIAAQQKYSIGSRLAAYLELYAE